jgi:hypothetical protein
MKLVVLFILTLCTQSAFALDFDVCSKMLNDGWYKKYEYGGVDQPLTKATKKLGSSKGMSATTTEGSTALSDPKYWSNVTTSETQFLSSWGDCSAIGLNEVKEIREKYYVQNRPEILKEMSQGQGRHLEVLSSFSLCDATARSDMGRAFQKNIKQFIDAKDGGYGQYVDAIIQKSSTLSKQCLSLQGV